MRNRRVAVNDELFVRLNRVKELVSNPHEIGRSLLFDRNARPNAGMYKQEVSATEFVAEALQEEIVRARKTAAKASLQLGICLKP